MENVKELFIVWLLKWEDFLKGKNSNVKWNWKYENKISLNVEWIKYKGNEKNGCEKLFWKYYKVIFFSYLNLSKKFRQY